jgi:thiol-disulfide isomerase/thioredoxin
MVMSIQPPSDAPASAGLPTQPTLAGSGAVVATATPDSADFTRLDGPSATAAEIVVRRRRLLLAGTAAVAALGGAAVQWLRIGSNDAGPGNAGSGAGASNKTIDTSQAEKSKPSAATPAPSAAEPTTSPHQNDVAALAKFWDLKFDTPNGPGLAMATLRGKPLVINFWATWCPPCVEELPLINGFFRENSTKGWQVLGIAVDNLAPVKNFLAKTPVDFPVALAGMAGVALSQSFGNLSGGLPFTVVIGAGGAILQRKIGKIGPDDLRAWAGLT